MSTRCLSRCTSSAEAVQTTAWPLPGKEILDGVNVLELAERGRVDRHAPRELVDRCWVEELDIVESTIVHHISETDVELDEH